jgi:hypothetical protein
VDVERAPGRNIVIFAVTGVVLEISRSVAGLYGRAWYRQSSLSALRPRQEIDCERIALKVLRGDFGRGAGGWTSQAQTALPAVGNRILAETLPPGLPGADHTGSPFTIRSTGTGRLRVSVTGEVAITRAARAAIASADASASILQSTRIAV